MGARVTRVLSKFNLENRAHQEIAKAKPTPAPRHPTTAVQDNTGRFQEEIKQKDEYLHTLLKEVYVDSRDPTMHVNKGTKKKAEHRISKIAGLGHLDIQTVPKGKISIAEALFLLSNHQRSPQTWTEQKIAEEYSLELKDVADLLTYFIPFAMEIFPPVDKKAVKP
ncbi:NADH dehydrogenase [ubiquinone] 1 alpha subcomplex assembly factor 4, partial [Varanus komodoensis]